MDLSDDGFEDEFLKLCMSINKQLMTYFLEKTGITGDELIEHGEEILLIRENHTEDGGTEYIFGSNVIADASVMEVFVHITQLSIQMSIHNMKGMLAGLSNAIEYLAKSNAYELIHGRQIDDQVVSNFLSVIGKRGADKRHAPMAELRKFALNLSNDYPLKKSANFIASEVKEKVLEKGRSINAVLSEHNAQNTIKKWINAERKRKREEAGV